MLICFGSRAIMTAKFLTVGTVIPYAGFVQYRVYSMATMQTESSSKTTASPSSVPVHENSWFSWFFFRRGIQPQGVQIPLKTPSTLLQTRSAWPTPPGGTRRAHFAFKTAPEAPKAPEPPQGPWNPLEAPRIPWRLLEAP